MDNSLNETPHNKYPIIYIVLYISLDFVQYIDYLIYLNGSIHRNIYMIEVKTLFQEKNVYRIFEI